VLFGAAAVTPASVSGQGTDPAAASALVREAEAFMEGYARDLRGGERERIIERYDPRGAYFVGQGRKTLLPLDSIQASYRGRWRPPFSFEWQDLSYEVVGPDAVVVTGRFTWGLSAEQRLSFSYTGLLLRQDGRLRIRLEDESGAPAPPP
jgi:hypothetical protein